MKKRIKKKIDIALYFYNLGCFLQRQGKWEQSINFFNKAIQKNDTKGLWHYKLGCSFEKLEKWDDARKSFKNAISRNNTKGLWHYKLGYSLQRQQKWKKAITSYKTAIKLNKFKAIWHFRLGYALQKTKCWSDSAISYRSAIKLNNSNSLWHDRLQFVINKSKSSYPNGLVKSFNRKKISGWVIPKGNNEKVLVKVNGNIIDKIFPGRAISLEDNSNDVVGFARVLKGLWQYLGPEDFVEFEYYGNIIPIEGYGLKYSYKKSKIESRTFELVNKINEGFIFNKYGSLKLSIVKNNIWKESIFNLFYSLKNDIKNKFNLELIPIYGTMLAAVREGEFISHDNDFDTCFISEKISPNEVKNEFIKICEFLIEKGYKIRVKKTHIWVYVKDRESFDFKLDIFISYFNKNNLYEIAYGYHGQAVSKSQDFFKYTEVQLSGYTISIPSNYRKILRQFYGDTWEIPDPGFKHQESTRKWDLNYHLSIEQRMDIYWKQFYKYKTQGDKSDFATFVNTLIPKNTNIVELGCGSGEDANYFAQNGHFVSAADKCKEALPKAKIKNINFSDFDIGDKKLLNNFIKNSLSIYKTNTSIIYMRCYLDSVTEETEKIALESSSKNLTSGSFLALEFRSDKDNTNKKLLNKQYIRLISMQQIIAKLQNHGFKIEHSDESNILKNDEKKESCFCRIIALKI